MKKLKDNPTYIYMISFSSPKIIDQNSPLVIFIST